MKQKFRLNFLKFYRKKAYLQIDFTFAIAFFFIFFFIIFNIYTSQIRISDDNLISSQMQADAKDICFLLVESSGNPNDWELNISSLGFIGLKNFSSQSLDSNKLIQLNSTNYFQILDSLVIDSYLYLGIIGLDTDNTYLDFGTRAGNPNYQANYVCYSSYQGEVVKVYVEVWK